MKNTYQNGVLTPVNPKRYAYIYRGVLYSSVHKAYKAMIGDGPELYPRKTELIENGQRLVYVGGNHLGSRISFSSLPDDVKKFVLDWLPLPNFRLPKVSTRYGAPMGRRNTAKGKCIMGKVHLYDGYDNGGAYWGSPSDLYCAKSKTSYGYFDDPAKPGFELA